MKTLIKTVSVVGLFAISGLALADQCPDSLSADEMYNCIVVEGAGGTYKPQTQQTQPVDRHSLQEIKAPLQSAPF